MVRIPSIQPLLNWMHWLCFLSAFQEALQKDTFNRKPSSSEKQSNSFSQIGASQKSYLSRFSKCHNQLRLMNHPDTNQITLLIDRAPAWEDEAPYLYSVVSIPCYGNSYLDVADELYLCQTAKWNAVEVSLGLMPDSIGNTKSTVWSYRSKVEKFYHEITIPVWWNWLVF